MGKPKRQEVEPESPPEPRVGNCADEVCKVDLYNSEVIFRGDGPNAGKIFCLDCAPKYQPHGFCDILGFEPGEMTL